MKNTTKSIISIVTCLVSGAIVGGVQYISGLQNRIKRLEIDKEVERLNLTLECLDAMTLIRRATDICKPYEIREICLAEIKNRLNMVREENTEIRKIVSDIETKMKMTELKLKASKCAMSTELDEKD